MGRYYPMDSDNIAIPAERKEQTMNDDLIKRSDAIEAITYSHLDNLTREERIAHINALPSADRPQGEWIFEEFLWGGYVRMKKPKCSVCKIGIDHLAIVLEDGSGWDMYKTADGSFRNLPRFCPSCGARMKGAYDETIRTEDI